MAYSRIFGASNDRWIKSLCMPTECPMQSVGTSRRRNAATASQEKNALPPITPVISMDVYQMDLAGAQTTSPFVAELLLLGFTRSVLVNLFFIAYPGNLPYNFAS